MKKIISILCVIFILFNLCACQDKKEINNDESSKGTQVIDNIDIDEKNIETWLAENMIYYNDDGSVNTSEYYIEIYKRSEQNIEFAFYQYRMYSVGNIDNPIIANNIGNDTFDFNYSSTESGSNLSGKISFNNSKMSVSLTETNYNYWSELLNDTIIFIPEVSINNISSNTDSSDEIENYTSNNQESFDKKESETELGTKYSVYAEQGAVVTWFDTDTGEFRYKEKCETCGEISDNEHSGGLYVTGSTKYSAGFTCSNSSCPMWGKSQRAIIAASEEYTDIPIS